MGGAKFHMPEADYLEALVKFVEAFDRWLESDDVSFSSTEWQDLKQIRERIDYKASDDE